MEQYINILKSVKLFENIDEYNLTSMLSCLGSKVVLFKKKEIILIAGDSVKNIGIVLNGSLHIVKEDSEGGRALIANLSPGDFFAEALCCAGIAESPVSVIADLDSAVMLLDFKRILNICPNSCGFHSKLIENMLKLIAQKNLMLQNRMELLSKKTLRKKILGYLKSLEKQHGNMLILPFNREELADFLCVDRSALSHELSRMKNDGILEYWKNNFKLL